MNSSLICLGGLCDGEPRMRKPEPREVEESLLTRLTFYYLVSLKTSFTKWAGLSAFDFLILVGV